ncbi:polysaccharide deacetylase family protein [Lysinibacter cavernae]|uniref:Peptidoglycan/xylan/chitin deacetylase (PgdA/CDA1 family) n=1 Tax=Lysinibacter cavernae TaxID=1640652 RepID=A0A7X5R2N3_9MICO|nr:polysaccharide deacetylase family protein [Lysinibacter cavernae]NIH54481.1 peptidoglycan/xylan/chitin deacetylase (PgdA/CDA1 family) [Lysinibacter cavernae]
MDRRGFLQVGLALAVGTLAGCAAPSTPRESLPTSSVPPQLELPSSLPTPASIAQTTELPVGADPAGLTKVPLPAGPITALPGDGNFLAWTIDDGADPAVIEGYARFAAESGARLTFFVNGMYGGWAQHADLLRPLVASGQVQIGNHTWSHVDLRSLSDQGVIDELQRNEQFIVETFGVSAKPFYRPPFGFRDARTDAAAASIGYTSPVMWYGSLSDSGLITTDQVVAFATQWFLPQHVIIGHANFMPVIEVLPQLKQLVLDRGLATVTLNDYFVTAQG